MSLNADKSLDASLFEWSGMPVLNWRSWPKSIIYFPLTLMMILKSTLLRGRPFFLTAANPKINMGGLLEDSKNHIYQNIPAKYIPKTVFIPQNSTWEGLVERFQEGGLVFPVFAKPNMGEGGFAVKRVVGWDDLKAYYQQHDADFLIQNQIPYSMELGVMVHDADGNIQINSLTEKVHFKLVGDGHSSIRDLMRSNPYYRFRVNKILKLCGEDGNRVLEEGEVFKPIFLGNWSQGAAFIDRKEWIDPLLTSLFQGVNDEIGLIHVGRYDILTPSLEALRRGEFQIVEINGIKSEVIHAFDPKYNIFDAYREFLHHWRHVYAISVKNFENGAKPVSLLDSVKQIGRFFYKKFTGIPRRKRV